MTTRLSTKWKERAKEDRANREQIKKNQKKILEDMADKQNILCPEDIKFTGKKSLAMSNWHAMKYRNEEYGIDWEQWSRKKNDLEFGKPKNYYFMDGSKKEYTDLQTLCNDWNEIKNYDDPNSEIEWVKVIKSKTN